MTIGRPFEQGRAKTAAASIVRDYGAQALAYVYCESGPGRRSSVKLLSKDEATGSQLTWRSCRSCWENDNPQSGHSTDMR